MENEVPHLPGDSEDMEISSGHGGPIRPSRGTDAVRVVKFVGFALLFNLLLWLFALFAQIRGWVDVTASYFILLAGGPFKPFFGLSGDFHAPQWCIMVLYGDSKTSSCKISAHKARPAKCNLARQDRETG